MTEATTFEQTIRALSEPFPANVIRHKPGGGQRGSLAYVSHGLVTKRLNDVAPGWSTRLLETVLNGTGDVQAVVLELTINGVSRVEAGAPSAFRDPHNDLKNAFSDALKRCAMRFGVALDLWESMDEGDEDAAHSAAPPANAPQPRPAAPGTPPATGSTTSPNSLISPKQVGFAKALARDAGLDELALNVLVSERYNRPLAALGKTDASALIDYLKALPPASTSGTAPAPKVAVPPAGPPATEDDWTPFWDLAKSNGFHGTDAVREAIGDWRGMPLHAAYDKLERYISKHQV